MRIKSPNVKPTGKKQHRTVVAQLSLSRSVKTRLSCFEPISKDAGSKGNKNINIIKKV